MDTKKLSLMALTISLAMVLSYVESLLPAFVAIPGIKIGLANIAVVFALYQMGTKQAFVISLIRVVLSAVLFSSFLTLMYSLSGAIVSLIIMAILKKTGLFSTVAVSIAGAVFHNLAQIVVACLIIKSDALKYYLPVLIIAGVIAGIAIGIVSSVIIKRTEAIK